MVPFVILAFCAFISTNGAEDITPDSMEASIALRDGANSFAFHLLSELSSVGDGNVVISPWSLTSLLLNLQEEAKGKTASELRKILSLGEDIEATRLGYSRITSNIMNNSFFDIQMENIFTSLEENETDIRNIYNRSGEQLNFKDSVQADGITRCLIAKHFANFTSDKGFVISNYLGFNNQWKYPFSIYSTKGEPFYLHKNERESIEFIIVPMMHRQDYFLYGDLPEMECEALVLPYKNNKFYMLILLPYRDSTVQTVISKFTSVEKISKSMSSCLVDLFLPRFGISSNLLLDKALKQLGVHELFSNATDLTGNSEISRFLTTGITHNAMMLVHEYRTVASGETIINRRSKSAFNLRATPQPFRVDRPFINIIVEKDSGVILFTSIVKRPYFL